MIQPTSGTVPTTGSELNYLLSFEHRHALLELSGELDEANAAFLEGLLWALEETDMASVDITADDVTFMSCRALRAILTSRTRWTRGGGTLRLVSASAVVTRLAQLAEAEAIFTAPLDGG